MEHIRQIQVISRWCSRLCSLAMFLPLLGIISLPWSLSSSYSHIRILGSIAAIGCGAYFFGLYKLQRLLKLYEKGIFFSKDNVVCFRAMGWALIIAAITVHWFDISFFTHDGFTTHFMDSLSSIFLELFGGAILIIIAWAMDEGRMIKEEQDQFI
jgi:hypothetical protein